MVRRNGLSLFKITCQAVTAVVIVLVLRGSIIWPEARPQEGKLYRKIELIDWHDYEKIASDKLRTGLGEQGQPAAGPGDFKANGFDAALSDAISMRRALPDLRPPGCAEAKYPSELPNVSVVVPFFNEHWSTLLRTVTSVLERSPPRLLVEIILVDDCSDKEFLMKQLDDYVTANFTKVSIIRLPTRQGLISARLAGAKKAVGEVLIFLDSHVEANVNWMPPLLEPISKNYKHCVCPFIDVIDHTTFEYYIQDEGARGGFNWDFDYKRLDLLDDDLDDETMPFQSPVMAGGLFAISADWFWELGGYDEGLEIWGGEQYELSFKIWMCGGEILDAPCSHVGHIYRLFSPLSDPGLGDYEGKNNKRVAEVWMDEYKEYLYDRDSKYHSIDPGNLTKQFEIRKNLKCKSFHWFMTKIAFDILEKYPPIEPSDFARGWIRSEAFPDLCVDTAYNDGPIKLDFCKFRNTDVHEQYFILGWFRDIKPSERKRCWELKIVKEGQSPTLGPCYEDGNTQHWRYNPNSKLIAYKDESLCLDVDESENLTLYVSYCDINSETQKWDIEFIDKEKLKYWENPEELLEMIKIRDD